MNNEKARYAAWAAALDHLDAEVTQIERMLAASAPPDEDVPVESWSPPSGLGPIPEELRPRADEILARQQAIVRDLAQALGANRRHAAFAARIEGGTPGAPRPSFIDHPA